MPNVMIEVRRKYTPAEEERIIAAVHAALDLFSGRSLPAKRALYRALVCNLGELGIPPDHIKVLLRESGAENWGIRGDVPASEVDLGFKIDV